MAKGERFTVDCTPSWEGLLPLFLETLADPNKADLHGPVREELTRMARLADAYRDLQRAEQVPAQ